MVITERIPAKHFEAFHALIKQSNGRYTINPQLIGTTYNVGYTFDIISDYVHFMDGWNAYMESMKPVKEKVSLKFKIISFIRRLLA